MEDVARQRGCDYLWLRQAADGGWHSETYGALRPGAAVTSLIVYALARGRTTKFAREEEDRWRRAAEFLRAGLPRRGCVACPDGTLDYPVYATALTLLADRYQPGLWTPAQRRQLVDYLLEAQVSESRGFAPDHAELGGWDGNGAAEARGITTGTNISQTRFALEAIATLDPPPAPPSPPTAPGRDSTADPDAPTSEPVDLKRRAAVTRTRELARRWLEHCQAWPTDGGFHFSPIRASNDNKAEWSDAQRQSPRSYGSATCDGLLALVAAGAPADDPRVRAARDWLVTHRSVDVVPGFPDDHTAGWHQALWFYYAAARRDCLRFFPAVDRDAQRAALVQQVLQRQMRDGSWSNPSARMREDDPLIATALAVVALSAGA